MTVKIIDIGVTGAPTPVFVSSPEQLELFSNRTLIAVYNAASGRSTSKFATREKARQQTWQAIQGCTEIDATTMPPVVRREEVGVPCPGPAPASDPSSSAVRRVGRGRPALPRQFKTEKQKDGTYLFNMEARTGRAAPGGRRPELLKQLRRRPTFAQLLERFESPGDTFEARAFNLATAITCMGGTCGYGVVTGSDGRLDLIEPLS